MIKNCWDNMVILLPILIIGITIIVIMLSIAWNRGNLKHAIVTVVGLIVSVVLSFNMMVSTKNNIQENSNIFQLVYVDNFSILHTVLVVFSSLASVISGYSWLLSYPNDRRDEFYLLLLLSTMGGVLLTITNHLVILFLGIELVSIPMCGLISYSVFQKRSIESGIKYIILSGVSSSFLLFGIAFIYCGSGSLSFIEIKELMLTYSNTKITCYQLSPMLLIVIGLSMMMVGIGFKLSFVPFHVWVPDVYQGASSSVSMYLATGSKVAVVSALIRFFLILPDQYNEILYIFLLSSACLSMLFGSIMAIQQRSIKRILAYASITNSGYLLAMLSTLYINTVIAQEAIHVYLISYLIANIGVFGIINMVSGSCVEKDNKDSDLIYLYDGLFWKSPVLSVMFTIIILSLAGIPLTFGFIGKFYLLLLGVSSKLWILTTFIIISSIISMCFYLKIMANLFRDYSMKRSNIAIDFNFLSNWIYKIEGWMIIIMVIIILYCGLYPQSIICLIQSM
ncbi:NADH-quinone oxidoreductase subunit N [Candidatus Blochmanniella vafra str. BVAF]|uniref:NADH-quinone oxidoreductase subunit N n=1 Tax=Blochmanniella vafra (strain BVAF) TaxID=859654 RepID=E8Q744_BLOVB|nr:NADH-quinone oxidoreductase subunit N [Candidatus Blochmannia vafer]ADV33868.1 NADH-quinone oxidoreductase subunit N [Candidatus Blochmannia vafer str. BVAF]